MAESLIAVTEGAGKNTSTWQRTKNSQTVEDQQVVISEPYLAAYTISVTTAISTGTANSHLLQIMAGASNRVLLRRLTVTQIVNAGAATRCVFQLLRLTTAGSGGTAYTPRALDPVDGAAGATAMTLPSSKGTEGNILGTWAQLIDGATPAVTELPILDIVWADDRTKSPAIAAGTSNGLALKNITAVATATVHITASIVEVAWS